MPGWKFLRKNEGLCFEWLIQKWTQNTRQCFWTDVQGTTLFAAILITFGKYLMLLEVSQRKRRQWSYGSPDSRKQLGQSVLGNPWWCELKLRRRNGINRLWKEVEQGKTRSQAGSDHTCCRLTSVALRIATSRVGRECKECQLQSWDLMCAVNLSLEKWNDMIMVQQIGGNGDDSVPSLHTTGFYQQCGLYS